MMLTSERRWCSHTLRGAGTCPGGMRATLTACSVSGTITAAMVDRVQTWEPPSWVTDVPTDEDGSTLWWILLLHGLFALSAGVLLLVWPDRTLTVVAIVAGVYLLAFGVLKMIDAVARPRLLTMERVIPATLGLLAVGAGTIVIARPENSVLAVALAAGIYLIVAGLMTGVVAIRDRASRTVNGLGALLNLTAGIVVVAWPDVTVTAIAVVLGISLVLRGAVEIVASIALARSRR
jgi:uncharacterized membrane protein HdeD (DUF308 family)